VPGVPSFVVWAVKDPTSANLDEFANYELYQAIQSTVDIGRLSGYGLHFCP
jgi:hypothetical protein